MKLLKRISFLLSITLLLSFTPDLLNNISKDLTSSSPENVSTYFINNIDLKIVNKEAIYSKQQAKMILKDFFSKHRVSSFKVVHKSQAQGGANYIIGRLVTSNGTFRVYLLNKNVGGAVKIQQFRIENE